MSVGVGASEGVSGAEFGNIFAVCLWELRTGSVIRIGVIWEPTSYVGVCVCFAIGDRLVKS